MKTLIIDDERLARNELRRLLENFPKIQIIGEAANMVPESVRANYPSVEWKKIAGLRDILAHQYFEVDLDIIWDILTNKLPELERQINAF